MMTITRLFTAALLTITPLITLIVGMALILGARQSGSEAIEFIGSMSIILGALVSALGLAYLTK